MYLTQTLFFRWQSWTFCRTHCGRILFYTIGKGSHCHQALSEQFLNLGHRASSILQSWQCISLPKFKSQFWQVLDFIGDISAYVHNISHDISCHLLVFSYFGDVNGVISTFFWRPVHKDTDAFHSEEVKVATWTSHFHFLGPRFLIYKELGTWTIWCLKYLPAETFYKSPPLTSKTSMFYLGVEDIRKHQTEHEISVPNMSVVYVNFDCCSFLPSIMLLPLHHRIVTLYCL